MAARQLALTLAGGSVGLHALNTGGAGLLMQALTLLHNGLGKFFRIGQDPARALLLPHITLPRRPMVFQELLCACTMGLLVVNELLLVHFLDDRHFSLALGALVVVKLPHRTLQLAGSLLALLDLRREGLLLELGFVHRLPILQLGALPGGFHERTSFLPFPLLHVLANAILGPAFCLGLDALALLFLTLPLLVHASLVLFLLLLLLLVLLVLFTPLNEQAPRKAAAVLLLELRQVQAGGRRALSILGGDGSRAYGQHVGGNLEAGGHLTQRGHDRAFSRD